MTSPAGNTKLLEADKAEHHPKPRREREKKEAAYPFYLNLAEATGHERTRKMFVKLADREIQEELKKLKAEKAKQ